VYGSPFGIDGWGDYHQFSAMSTFIPLRSALDRCEGCGRTMDDEWMNSYNAPHRAVSNSIGSHGKTAPQWLMDSADASFGGCHRGFYPREQWNACVFDGIDSNSYVRSESWAKIDYDWGSGGPQGRSDNYSVEARSSVCFSAGKYRFHTLSDDGVRLDVNGSRVIDNWTDHGTSQNDSAPISLNGCVPLSASFYERGGGSVFKVWWEAVPECNRALFPSGSWNACVFDGTNSDSYVGTQSWSSIDYDWGSGGPLGRSDNFSVEARGTFCFAAGDYRFHTLSDDGFQLDLNGWRMIDNWTHHGATQNDGGALHLDGCMQLYARFFEGGGNAVFKVWWESVPSTTRPFSASDSRATTQTGDWDPYNYKAECAPGERVKGLSAFTSGNHAAHAVRCTPGLATTYPQGSCRTVRFASGDNLPASPTIGNWDSGYYKGECAADEYVAGVSQSTALALDAILCCRGAVTHASCSPLIFNAADAREVITSDWDPYYYKGECGHVRYVAGVSRNVSNGAAHAILCCTP
jgi:hypothetical protein